MIFLLFLLFTDSLLARTKCIFFFSQGTFYLCDGSSLLAQHFMFFCNGTQSLIGEFDGSGKKNGIWPDACMPWSEVMFFLPIIWLCAPTQTMYTALKDFYFIRKDLVQKCLYNLSSILHKWSCYQFLSKNVYLHRIYFWWIKKKLRSIILNRK